MSQLGLRQLIRLHDHESGQVFYESSCAEQSSGGVVSTWLNATRGRPNVDTKTTLDATVPSLEELALRTIAAYAFTISLDALRTVPWVHAAKIWQRLGRLELQSVKLWQIFVTLYYGDDSFKKLGEKRPPKILPENFLQTLPSLASPSLAWITILSLHEGLGFTRADWMKLGGLPNLVLLCTETILDSGIDDRVVSAWGRQAQDAHCFPNLRMMLLCMKAPSTVLFESLAYLPKLDICHLRFHRIPPDFGGLKEPGQTGSWTHGQSSKVCIDLSSSYHRRDHNGGQPTERSRLSQYYQLLIQYQQNGDEDAGTQSLDNKPILNVRCGSDHTAPYMMVRTAGLWFERDRQIVPQSVSKRPSSPGEAQGSRSKRKLQLRPNVGKDSADLFAFM